MLKALSRKWELACSEPCDVMDGCMLGTGIVSAAALFWGAKHPVAKSVLGVFMGALILRGTGCVLRRSGNDPASSELTWVVGECFRPVGRTIGNLKGLMQLFDKGYGIYAPANSWRYSCYAETKQFKEDCQKTKVYYSQHFDVDEKEAYRMVAQRHLVNIGGKALGNQDAVAELLGAEAARSYIHEGAGSQRKMPGLVGVFTHTPVIQVCCTKEESCSCIWRWWRERMTWDEPGSGDPNISTEFGDPNVSTGLGVDLFSVPGPALDSPAQPYFDYFVSAEGKLDGKRYGEYMKELFKMALCAFFDESEATEFILPEVGLDSFLDAIEPAEKQVAVDQFYSSLEAVLKIYRTEMWKKRAQDRGVEKVQFTSIFFSEEERERRTDQLGKIREVLEDSSVTTYVKAEVAVCDIQEYLVPHIKDIMPSADEGMGVLSEYLSSQKVEDRACPFVVNPCDPAARIGNHNDPSRSFDGAIGNCTPASLVASPAHNESMTERARYIAV